MMEGREFPHVLARGFRRNGILDPDFPGSSSCRALARNGLTRAAYEAVFPWCDRNNTPAAVSVQGGPPGQEPKDYI